MDTAQQAQQDMGRDTDHGGLAGFLAALHGASGPGEIELRTRVVLRGGKEVWPSRWAEDPARATTLAQQIIERCSEVFVGVGRRLERGLDADAVELLPAAWVDLDPLKDATPYELDTYRAVQRRRLAGLEYPPSTVLAPPPPLLPG